MNRIERKQKRDWSLGRSGSGWSGGFEGSEVGPAGEAAARRDVGRSEGADRDWSLGRSGSGWSGGFEGSEVGPAGEAAAHRDVGRSGGADRDRSPVAAAATGAAVSRVRRWVRLVGLLPAGTSGGPRVRRLAGCPGKTGITQGARSLECRRVVSCRRAVACVWLVMGQCVFPCGPFFPNRLLDAGDEALLAKPQTAWNLGVPLDQLRPGPSRYRAAPVGYTNSAARQTLECDLLDLATALEAAEIPDPEKSRISTGHRNEREKILPGVQADETLRATTNRVSLLRGDTPALTPGLPVEFAEYFRGSVAWHLGQETEARQAWMRVLELPPEDRQFKSTWAAFMLGRSFEEASPRQAIRYFRLVRQFVDGGMRDSLGLAVASLGYEGRIHLRQRDHAEAVGCYLDQLAAGDPSAPASLRAVCSDAVLDRSTDLKSLAKDPVSRAVLSGYVVSITLDSWRRPRVHVDSALTDYAIRQLGRIPAFARSAPGWHRYQDPADRWLEAIEAAEVTDVDLANILALAAYQIDDVDRATRWLKVARTEPLAEWLRAKLLLREGNILEATARLARICRQFPESKSGDAGLFLEGPGGFYVDPAGWDPHRFTEQVQAELGVLLLARREYTEALHLLVGSEHWLDAAYVAERVLTIRELQDYVDQFWPASTEAQARDLSAEGKTMGEIEARRSAKLRYLLARRLARAHRWEDAQAYYPTEWQEPARLLEQRLRLARDESQPAAERARRLWEAAKQMRHQGMELIGTECEPDWRVWEGAFEEGVTVASRATNNVPRQVVPSSDELRRAAEHKPAVQERFHYRYLAADLAWEAAKRMPDHTDETARVLCLAGTWLKLRDPKAADRFYKALVRRCRKTEMGALADRLRWFPKIDDDGNLL